MTFPASRAVSAATAAYGLFAAVRPDHLGTALEVGAARRPAYRLLAYTYAGRDLSISAAALLGRDAATVTTAMRLRIAMDLADCVVLVATSRDTGVRLKVAAVTLGWAAVNTAALLRDRAAAVDAAADLS